MIPRVGLGLVAATLCVSITVLAQTPPSTAPGQRRMIHDSDQILPLSEIRMRDVCILPDTATQTYYMVGPGFNSVRIFTSKDLKSWQGSKTIYRTPEDIWGDIRVINIWAPEMHKYKDKYYLFLTFDTRNKLQEQWRGWYPRVTRGSQILAADAPTGPFKPFANHSTPPTDMMTLDGTLWVEDGVPYMVFCHEWVQICNGTIEFIQLKDDLSETVGEPKKMFHATAAPWPKSGVELGNTVTDGPFLYSSCCGKT